MSKSRIPIAIAALMGVMALCAPAAAAASTDAQQGKPLAESVRSGETRCSVVGQFERRG